MSSQLRSYILLRILVIIPTLIIISLVIFFLSQHVPQDPASTVTRMRVGDEPLNQELIYDEVYRDLSMHLPNFYFSITPRHYPATLNSISNKDTRKKVKELLQSGIPYSKIVVDGEKVRSSYSGGGNKILFPKVHWNGFSNKYHTWIKSFFSGSMGYSLIDNQPVSTRIGKAFLWTITLGFIGIAFAYPVAILIGMRLARNSKSRSNKLINQFLYLLYSIPFFWIATMMVIYFTTDTYGSWMNIFPSVGVQIYPGKSTLYQIIGNAKNFILPVFCLSIPAITYIATFVKRGIINEMSQPYITLAATKGLTQKQILRKHAFPNALLPLITIFAESIASVLGGTLLIEVIFNIPGIGRLLFDSIGTADWNIVFSIVLVVALITTLSYLLGDILYALANPKIRFA